MRPQPRRPHLTGRTLALLLVGTVGCATLGTLAFGLFDADDEGTVLAGSSPTPRASDASDPSGTSTSLAPPSPIPAADAEPDAYPASPASPEAALPPEELAPSASVLAHLERTGETEQDWRAYEAIRAQYDEARANSSLVAAVDSWNEVGVYRKWTLWFSKHLAPHLENPTQDESDALGAQLDEIFGGRVERHAETFAPHADLMRDTTYQGRSDAMAFQIALLQEANPSAESMVREGNDRLLPLLRALGYPEDQLPLPFLHDR